MGNKITPALLYRDDAKGRNLHIRVYNDDTGEVKWIKPEIIERGFLDYLHWVELYKCGQITKETAMMILEADHLMQYYREDEWVLVREGFTSEEMDARYIATGKREQLWNVIMGKRSSPAFPAMLSDYIGEVLKTL